MEQYATEEQQVEAIKRFWKENGMAIIVGAALGLGGLWGWRYYNDSQRVAQEQASVGYQQASENLGQEDAAYGKALAFVNANPDSSYAVLAAFQLAQQAVERNDLDEALKQLEFAAKGAGISAVQSLANIRIARIQLEQQKLDDVLATLEAITDPAYVGQVEEIKGDVYLAQKLFDKARAAYSLALQHNANNNVLKMKLDNIAQASNV
jgi:predicted negative regulator of RcsB-dependent stress response